MTYQAASGAGAQNMRELVAQMGDGRTARARPLLADPASAILDIDREVADVAARPRVCPSEHFGVPLAGSLHPLDRQGPRQRPEPRGVEGQAETQQDPRPRTRAPIPIDGICVRIGAMRCHSQALTIKLQRATCRSTRSKRMLASANAWVKVVPNKREDTHHAS